MHIGAAQRELSWTNGERFLAPRLRLRLTRGVASDTVLPKGAQF